MKSSCQITIKPPELKNMGFVRFKKTQVRDGID